MIFILNMERPVPGMKRTPCERMLLALSDVATVEISDCGIREVHLGGITVKLNGEGFEKLVSTLNEAQRNLWAAQRQDHPRPLFSVVSSTPQS